MCETNQQGVWVIREECDRGERCDPRAGSKHSGREAQARHYYRRDFTVQRAYVWYQLQAANLGA